jgi:hypothetical protein
VIMRCMVTWIERLPCFLNVHMLLLTLEKHSTYMGWNLICGSNYIWIWNVLAIIWTIPILFKNLTNFTLIGFEDLVSLMLPKIITHNRSTGWDSYYIKETIKINNHKHYCINFILFMKHENVIMCETFMWNWSKNSL